MSVLNFNGIDKGIAPQFDNVLGANRWVSGRNIRFRPGYVMKTKGRVLAHSPFNDPVRAIFAFQLSDGKRRIICCSDTKIISYVDGSSTAYDVTPTVLPFAQVPAEGKLSYWQFAIIGGMPILSNRLNFPWKLNSLTVGDKFVPLLNVAGAPRCMMVLKNRLVFGGFNRLQSNESSATWATYAGEAAVAWSDIYNPENWKHDRQMRSDRRDLMDGSTAWGSLDYPVAMTNIHEHGVVFTGQNIWNMVSAPNPYGFMFSVKYNGLRILGTNLFAKSKGGWPIYFMGEDDFYEIGPDYIKSIGLDIRKSCFDTINRAEIKTGFCYEQVDTREIHFCVPTGANTTPDTDFVYQVETNAWTILDCGITCAAEYKYTPIAAPQPAQSPAWANAIWTIRTTPQDYPWNGIAFGNVLGEKVFIAVANQTLSDNVMRSVNGGATWNSVSHVLANLWSNWFSVEFGNNTFVASRRENGTYNERIMRSVDGGNTWTIVNTQTNTTWGPIAFGNGVFVSVSSGIDSSNAGIRAMRSIDNGASWVVVSTPIDYEWVDVKYGNGVFVAIAKTGTDLRLVMRSTDDGLTWSLATVPVNNTWVAIEYGNGVFVAIGQSGYPGNVMTSPDGITWTLRTLPVDRKWKGIAFGSGKFVVVGQTIGVATQLALASADGIKWFIDTTPSTGSDDWTAVAFGDEKFVAVGVSSVLKRAMTRDA